MASIHYIHFNILLTKCIVLYLDKYLRMNNWNYKHHMFLHNCSYRCKVLHLDTVINIPPQKYIACLVSTAMCSDVILPSILDPYNSKRNPSHYNSYMVPSTELRKHFALCMVAIQGIHLYNEFLK